MTKPVQYAEKRQYIPSYTLGVLIGDGTLSRISITNSEKDIMKKVTTQLKSIGYCLNQTKDENKNDLFNILMTKEKRNEFYEAVGMNYDGNLSPFKSELSNLGLLNTKSSEKFIPLKYLQGSIEQRLELLKGLVDTDGYVNGSYVEYSTSSQELAFDIKNLCESLGLTCAINVKEHPTYTYRGEKLIGLPSYRLTIKTSENIPKIHSSEKHENKWKKGQSSARRTIRDIKETDRYAKMTCISVGSPDKLFLANNFIVTHNTSLALSAAYYLIKEELASSVIYVRNTVSVRENGFLPGTVEEKEMAYMKPAVDIIDRIGARIGNQDLYGDMLMTEQIQCTSTSFLRGVDYEGPMVLIIDEAQNLDMIELQTVLTRPHDSVKIIVIGSSLQNDNHKIRKSGPEKLLPFQVYA